LQKKGLRGIKSQDNLDKMTMEQRKAMGRKGGLIGGPARAAILTPLERIIIARKAGKAAAAKRGGKAPAGAGRKTNAERERLRLLESVA
jgi:hypothetical protein